MQSAQTLQGPHRSHAPAASEIKPTTQPADELTLSAEGSAISQLRGNSEIRADRVAQIRAEIAAGTYDTDAKLESAVSRLLDEIA